MDVEYVHEVILHGLCDVIQIVPFLYITYLFIEYLEHKTSKLTSLLTRHQRLGPVVGAAVGAIPQCGFSTIAANLFCSGAITIGTLIAVFLSTSDEMLPILISSSVSVTQIALIVIYKVIMAILAGLFIDKIYYKVTCHKPCGTIETLCEDCDCEHHNIFYSALIHTLQIGAFILFATLLINTLLYCGAEYLLQTWLTNTPLLSHLLASIVGLIPNCGASVILTELYINNFISVGTMLSGLFTGAGVGLLVLVRAHKCKREVLHITLLTILFGVLGGAFADIILLIFN